MLGIRKYRGIATDLYQGDITKFACDAMVNAANSELAGGGGVDGAIHRIGGPVILEECRKIGGCPTGQAVSTAAGDLPAKWVIHTVGPVWHGGNEGEEDLLFSAYHESLKKADELAVRHLAFSAISTGVYRYPLDQAAATAMRAVRNHLTERTDNGKLERITFVLFTGELYSIFQKALFATFPEETPT